MQVKFNDSDDYLWCVECKSRINLGTKYIKLYDEYDEDYERCYHPECLPEMEEED